MEKSLRRSGDVHLNGGRRWRRGCGTPIGPGVSCLRLTVRLELRFGHRLYPSLHPSMRTAQPWERTGEEDAVSQRLRARGDRPERQAQAEALLLIRLYPEAEFAVNWAVNASCGVCCP